MKKILPCALAALSGLAILAAAPRAQAADFTPAFAANRAGGYFDLWPTRDAFVTMFGAELQLRVARSVFLDMSFSGAYAESDAGFHHAAYGNPTFGAHYAGEVTPRFHFFVGGTASLPLLHDPDYEVATTAAVASLIRGYYDADRMWPGTLAVRAMGGFEWQATRRFFLRAEVRPVVFLRTNDRFGATFAFATPYGSTHDADLMIEHAIDGEIRFDNGFGFGARVQAVITPSTDDAIQTMVEPYIALTPRTRGLYLHAGTPVAIDRSLGFGLDRGRLATLRFAIGGQW